MDRGKELPGMTGHATAPVPEAGAAARRPRPRAARLPANVEAEVARFAAPVRREMRRLIRQSPRFQDLIIVFPGAAFAIASRRGPKADREAATEMISNGAPLKSVARRLGLPMWLKKLPPEAFLRPLGPVPSGETFARRISSRMPRATSHSAFWLEAVLFANEACGEDFALWLAEQPLFADRSDASRLFGVLAAYAWFSRSSTTASRLIVVPWRPEIAFDTALCSAKSWLNRLRLLLQLEPGALTDTWLVGKQVSGYDFVPLIDRDALLLEAQAMQNCADQYAERLAREKCRLFSVRRNGNHVATLEVGPHGRETGVLCITQLKARHNMPASIEVWQAAYAWLALQSGLKRLPPMVAPERPFNERVWRELMAPYRDAVNGAPWLPQRLSQPVFARLDMDTCDLARRGNVTSWLFT